MDLQYSSDFEATPLCSCRDHRHTWHVWSLRNDLIGTFSYASLVVAMTGKTLYDNYRVPTLIDRSRS